MRRAHRATLLVFASLLASACSDGPTDPPSVVYGRYRLTSVGGLPLPYRYRGNILGGELLIRNDNSFEFVYSGNPGDRFTGTFQNSTGALTLSPDSAAMRLSDTTVIGHALGDSLVLKVPPSAYDFNFSSYQLPLTYLTFVLHRVAADPVAITSGVYVLTTINGQSAPFAYASNGTPTSVFYDTLAFHDGVFCTRSRAQRTGNDRNNTESSYRFPCTYRGNASAVTLRSFFMDTNALPLVAPPSRDSFVVVGTSLVRRTWGTTGVIDERYERVR